MNPFTGLGRNVLVHDFDPVFKAARNFFTKRNNGQLHDGLRRQPSSAHTRGLTQDDCDEAEPQPQTTKHDWRLNRVATYSGWVKESVLE